MARRRRSNRKPYVLLANRKPYVLLENRKPYVLLNPQGLKIGKGSVVLSGRGSKTHVFDPDTNRTLCGSGNTRPSTSKTIYCYRCIKLMNLNAGNTIRRDIAYSKRPDVDNYMIPGGSEGAFVGLSDFGPYGEAGDPNFPLRLPAPHPTQPALEGARRRKARPKKKSRAAARAANLLAGRQVANPRKKRSRGAAEKLMWGDHSHLGSLRPAEQKSYEAGVDAALRDFREGKAHRSEASLARRSEYYVAGYKGTFSGGEDVLMAFNPRKKRGRTAAKKLMFGQYSDLGSLREAEHKAYGRGLTSGRADYEAGKPKRKKFRPSASLFYKTGYAEGYDGGPIPMSHNPRRTRKNRGSRRRR